MEGDPFLLKEQTVTRSSDENKWYKSKRGKVVLGFALVTVLIILVLGFAIAGIRSRTAQEHSLSADIPERKPSDVLYEYESAAVAADASICSAVGKGLLQNGGNAVDAAIGSLLCTGLASPQSMGIGGGFFMTIYNVSNQQGTIIDSRNTAPEKATYDMFKGNAELSAHGPLSIAIPGEIKGYWLAHQKYGRLPWSSLFKPTIDMAKDGFPVPIGLHTVIHIDEEKILKEPSLREVFINPNTNKLYQYNEIMFRPKLAKTLEILAEGGIKAWEEDGDLLDDILEDLKDIGAIVTKKDIKEYKALEKEPLEISLDDSYRLLSPPPPSSGAVLSFVMNILEGYDLTSGDIVSLDAKILTYHRIVEAFKFSFAKRSALGDEDFVDVEELVRNLTSKAYAAEIRQKITDERTHTYDYYRPSFYTPQKTGTSHISVLDQEGNAVSVTSTINGRWGSGLRGKRTGIIWNNLMDDFSSVNITNIFDFLPSETNLIKPGKRPQSSMCPAILVATKEEGEGTDAGKGGNVRLVVGAAGGSLISSTVTWISAHNLWLGLNMKDAVDSLRLHHQLIPTQLQHEEGFDEDVLQGLKAKGHNLTSFGWSSIAQGIAVQDGRIIAASDFRKGATPDGF